MAVRDRFGWVGQTIASKLRVDEVVAEGGFAVVYRAYHLGFGERVALKCLKLPAQLEGEERDRFLDAFLSEGKLLHRLSRSSSGIVQALDIGAAVSPSGVWTPYLALEWLDGMSVADDLADRERRGAPPRTVTEVLELLESAAAALSLAHADGVVHRDIKPSNLIIAELGERRVTKVVDFGIAKVMTDASTTTTAIHVQTGARLPAFSPAYGAPEQFDRRYGKTGPWTDVFAFALVIVELLAGRSALDGEEPLQLFVAAANPARRPTPRTLGAAVPDAVERVLARAVSVDPAARQASIGELWRDLTAAAKVRDVPAPRLAPIRLATRPSPRLTPRIGIAAAIMTAALLTGLGLGAAFREDEPRPASTAVTLTSAAAPKETPPPREPAPPPRESAPSTTAPREPAAPHREAAPSAEPYVAGETIRASHILVQYAGSSASRETRTKEEARARAGEVLQRLEAGADFEALAAEYGDDATRTRGGSLGQFSRTKFPGPFTRAAFALRPGEHSGIVETRYGFHVVLRTE